MALESFERSQKKKSPLEFNFYTNEGVKEKRRLSFADNDEHLANYKSLDDKKIMAAAGSPLKYHDGQGDSLVCFSGDKKQNKIMSLAKRPTMKIELEYKILHKFERDSLLSNKSLFDDDSMNPKGVEKWHDLETPARNYELRSSKSKAKKEALKGSPETNRNKGKGEKVKEEEKRVTEAKRGSKESAALARSLIIDMEDDLKLVEKSVEKEILKNKKIKTPQKGAKKNTTQKKIKAKTAADLNKVAEKSPAAKNFLNSSNPPEPKNLVVEPVKLTAEPKNNKKQKVKVLGNKKSATATPTKASAFKAAQAANLQRKQLSPKKGPQMGKNMIKKKNGGVKKLQKVLRGNKATKPRVLDAATPRSGKSPSPAFNSRTSMKGSKLNYTYTTKRLNSPNQRSSTPQSNQKQLLRTKQQVTLQKSRKIKSYNLISPQRQMKGVSDSTQNYGQNISNVTRMSQNSTGMPGLKNPNTSPINPIKYSAEQAQQNFYKKKASQGVGASINRTIGSTKPSYFQGNVSFHADRQLSPQRSSIHSSTQNFMKNQASQSFVNIKSYASPRHQNRGSKQVFEQNSKEPRGNRHVSPGIIIRDQKGEQSRKMRLREKAMLSESKKFNSRQDASAQRPNTSKEGKSVKNERKSAQAAYTSKFSSASGQLQGQSDRSDSSNYKSFNQVRPSSNGGARDGRAFGSLAKTVKGSRFGQNSGNYRRQFYTQRFSNMRENGAILEESGIGNSRRLHNQHGGYYQQQQPQQQGQTGHGQRGGNLIGHQNYRRFQARQKNF